MNAKRQVLAVVAVMLVAGAPGAVGVAWGQCATELKKLTAADAAASDMFGWSVSLSGDTTIVGASFDDDGGIDSGSAYIFQGDAGGLDNWGQVKKLIASDAAVADMFGFSVSLSGDTAIVGAPQNSDVGFYSGSAYIFQGDAGGLDNWGEVKKLTASDAASEDEFGYSVSLSGDTAIVGTRLDDGSDSGWTYIFQRDAGGPDNWGQVAKLTASDAAAGDMFGTSVSLSGDTAIVGAGFDDDGGADSGSAYIFQRDFGGLDNWGQVGKLTASDAAAGDWFGRSVSISGDVAVVGATHDDDAPPSSGSAYVFERNAGGPDAWVQVAKLTASDAQMFAFFGNSVAVAGDVVVVGAYEDDVNALAGSAYVFKRPPAGWDSVPSPINETAKLTDADAAQGDMYGSCVSISGNVAVIGVSRDDDDGSDSGSAYLYDLPNGCDPTCIPAKMYWTDMSAREIWRSDLNGGNRELLFTEADGLVAPQWLTLDPAAGKMYWSAGVMPPNAQPWDPPVFAAIRRANMNGTGLIENLLTFAEDGIMGPTEIVLDPAKGVMLFADFHYSANRVQRAVLDGSGLVTVVQYPTSAYVGPLGIAFDPVADKVYWTVFHYNQIDWALPWPNQTPTTLLSLPNCGVNCGPTHMALDLTNRMMYWVFWDSNAPAGGRIHRAPLDNPALIETVVDSAIQNQVLSLALDVPAGKLYWSEGDRIRRTNLDGSGPIEDVMTLGSAIGIALDLTGSAGPDCNGNGITDTCEIASGTAQDCNLNGVPDECDIASGFSQDADGDGIPDECVPVPGNWIGPDGGLFNDAVNWNPSVVPQEEAILQNNSGIDNRAVIDAATSIGLNDMTIDATAAGNQIVRIDAGSSLDVSQLATIGQGGVIDLQGGTLSGVFNVLAGGMVSGWGSVAALASVSNDGRIEANSPVQTLSLDGTITNTANAVLAASNSATLNVVPPDQTVNFLVEATGGSTIFFSGLLTNDGRIELNQSELNAGDQLTNNTELRLNGSPATVTTTGAVVNNGEICVASGIGQFFGSALQNNPGANINIAPGAFTFVNGALLLPGGGVNWGASCSFVRGGAGTPATLTVLGDLQADAPASLLAADGNLQISGNFDVAIDDGVRFDFSAATVQLIGATQEIEVLAPDLGPDAVLSDPSSLSIGTLEVVSPSATVTLVDNHGDNGNEVLYVDALILAPGMTLNLAGQKLYYATASPMDLSGVTIVDSVGCGGLFPIAPQIKGDMNCDDVLDFSDVAPFILALTDPEMFCVAGPGCNMINGDMNDDTLVDGQDVQLFVDSLLNP